MKLPEVFEQVLATLVACEGCDYKLHPRISDKLWDAHREARSQLRAVYPELDDWLFGAQAPQPGARLAELRRLVTP